MVLDSGECGVVEFVHPRYSYGQTGCWKLALCTRRNLLATEDC